MNRKQYNAAVEALLFAHGEPVTVQRLAETLGVSTAEVETSIDALRERYASEDSGLCLLHLDERWQLATKQEYGQFVKSILNTRRNTPLSPAAMETLTIVAYNQPVSRSFIEQVRGVDSSSSVASLMEKGLIEEAGRMDLPGRPIAFRTTDTFLRTFGLTSLHELPPIHTGAGEREPELMQQPTQTQFELP
jgi:segregation and condensation protein B